MILVINDSNFIFFIIMGLLVALRFGSVRNPMFDYSNRSDLVIRVVRTPDEQCVLSLLLDVM